MKLYLIEDLSNFLFHLTKIDLRQWFQDVGDALTSHQNITQNTSVANQLAHNLIDAFHVNSKLKCHITIVSTHLGASKTDSHNHY